MKKLVGKNLTFTSITSAICIFIAVTSVQANLLINGSFEQGPGGYFANVPVGSTVITGWTVIRGSIDYGPGWQNADGNWSLDLDGSPFSPNSSTAGGVQQGFATVSNQQYQVTFAMAANPDSVSPHIETMVVQAAGQSANFSFDPTGHTDASMGWVNLNWTFTAIGPTTTLEFYSTDAPTNQYNGPTLDNVSAVAVPEPSSLALTIFALLLTIVARRR